MRCAKRGWERRGSNTGKFQGAQISRTLSNVANK
jgi:hypothetical protein